MRPAIKPGWFSRSGQKYLTLSEVPRTLEMTASELTDAISNGAIQIERIAGCKAVALGELYRFIDERGEQK